MHPKWRLRPLEPKARIWTGIKDRGGIKSEKIRRGRLGSVRVMPAHTMGREACWEGPLPLFTFSVVQLLRYSGSTLPMLPFSGNIWMTSKPDSLAGYKEKAEKKKNKWKGFGNTYTFNQTADEQSGHIRTRRHLEHRLTFPAQSTSQFTSKESTSNDGDRLDFPGNFFQGLEVTYLKKIGPTLELKLKLKLWTTF